MGEREIVACQAMMELATEQSAGNIRFTATELADRMNAFVERNPGYAVERMTARSTGWLLNGFGVEKDRGSDRKRSRSRLVRRADLQKLVAKHLGETSDHAPETSDIRFTLLRRRIDHLCEAHQALMRARDAELRDDAGVQRCDVIMQDIEKSVEDLLKVRDHTDVGKRLHRQLKQTREA